MDTNKMNVIVHKQKIQLLEDESINKFTQEISDAAREHLMKKLNMVEGKGGCWPMEIFADKLIMSVYKNDGPSKIYQIPYTRKSGGDFDFGSTIEVERVTTFKPMKPSVVISKSVGHNNETTTDGWIPVAKKLWENVL